MADKYVSLNSGRLQEVEGTVVGGDPAQAGDLVALDGSGLLDATILPSGVGPDIKSVTAGEALSAGDFVNIYNDAGTVKAQKADATASGKEVDGFVLSGATSGVAVDVYFEGRNTQLSGLTIGARYYLNTTAGAVTTTVPSSSGNVVQYVGRALSATELAFEPSEGIILA